MCKTRQGTQVRQERGPFGYVLVCVWADKPSSWLPKDPRRCAAFGALQGVVLLLRAVPVATPLRYDVDTAATTYPIIGQCREISKGCLKAWCVAMEEVLKGQTQICSLSLLFPSWLFPSLHSSPCLLSSRFYSPELRHSPLALLETE